MGVSPHLSHESIHKRGSFAVSSEVHAPDFAPVACGTLWFHIVKSVAIATMDPMPFLNATDDGSNFQRLFQMLVRKQSLNLPKELRARSINLSNRENRARSAWTKSIDARRKDTRDDLVHDLLANSNVLGIKLGLVHAILEAYFFSYCTVFLLFS